MSSVDPLDQTPLLDGLASGLAGDAWKRWQSLPDDDAILLTKRELGLLMEALLHISRPVQKTDGAPALADPVASFVESAIRLAEKDIVIDGGTY